MLTTSMASPSLTRARGGSQDEEKLLLYDSALNTGGGHATVHSVLDCQK